MEPVAPIVLAGIGARHNGIERIGHQGDMVVAHELGHRVGSAGHHYGHEAVSGGEFLGFHAASAKSNDGCKDAFSLQLKSGTK